MGMPRVFSELFRTYPRLYYDFTSSIPFTSCNFESTMLFRLFFVSLLLCSCSGQRMTQTELYFGQLTLNRDTLTEHQWNTFAQQYISKVLPNGCTVISATGNWYDTAQHRLVTEPSRVVVSVNKMSPRFSKQIDSLRYLYKTLYQQQSVLRVDRKVKMKLF
jgi:hypothetical protein